MKLATPSYRLPNTPAAAAGPTLDQAIGWLRDGRMEQAEAAFANLRARRPRDADVLHFSGVLRQRQGRVDEGIALIRASIAELPSNPHAHNNLGNLLTAAHRLAEALPCYEASLAFATTAEARADAWTNIAALHRRLQHPAEAEEAARQAVEAGPSSGAAWYALAHVLAESGRVAECVQAYSKAVSLRSASGPGRTHVLQALMAAGAREQAAALLREWQAQAPQDAVVAHMLAACEGRTPERASDAYVVKVFDDFADSFDAKLASLNYRAPELVAQAVRAACGEPAGTLDIADAGCGTGLCGPLLRPFARTLCGFDLSPGMLARATDRGYDELAAAELTQYLRAHPAAWDLVVSADTLCYFGDLGDVLQAAAQALRPGGWLVFTVEALPDGGAPFTLHLHGRYAHARAHLLERLAAAGFEADPAIEAVVPRRETGRDVAGWLVSARRGVLQKDSVPIVIPEPGEAHE